MSNHVFCWGLKGSDGSTKSWSHSEWWQRICKGGNWDRLKSIRKTGAVPTYWASLFPILFPIFKPLCSVKLNILHDMFKADLNLVSMRNTYTMSIHISQTGKLTSGPHLYPNSTTFLPSGEGSGTAEITWIYRKNCIGKEHKMSSISVSEEKSHFWYSLWEDRICFLLIHLYSSLWTLKKLKLFLWGFKDQNSYLGAPRQLCQEVLLKGQRDQLGVSWMGRKQM